MSRIGFNDKDMEKVAKEARQAGWVIEITKGQHVRWKSPDGVTILVSSLTGSSRSWSNFRSMLRRHGVVTTKHDHRL